MGISGGHDDQRLLAFVRANPLYHMVRFVNKTVTVGDVLMQEAILINSNKSMGRWTTILITMIICTTLAGCSTASSTPQGALVSNANIIPKNGMAVVPPQIDGTIQSIQTGDPSYVVLKDVVETVTNTGKIEDEIHKSEEKLKLPNGHFVSPNHWQSDGETLDLFIGDSFTMSIDTEKMIDISSEQQFAGIVKSINDKEMVIQKILYGTTSGAMKYTDQSVTIHLAPYTSVSLYGSNRSQITVGDAALFVLIGPPTDYIATQITCFSSTSDAGWQME
jgi:hypothetical protein